MEPKNYIFIHGAWHGSWCWKKIATRMKQFNHNVLTADLPGHWNNKMDFRNVTLQRYVEYITALALSVTGKVILVGHSMAGVVISQVGEIIPDKIQSLIYISGFVPDHQGSLFDQEKLAKFPSVALEVSVNEQECSISLNQEKIQKLFYNHCTEEDVQYALSML